MSAELAQENHSYSTAEAPDEAYAGPVCQKCEQPVPDADMSVCPSCGWYAAAGVHVDIAPEWEAGTAGAEAPKTFLQVWSTLIPKWCWVAWSFGVLAVAGSIAVRVLIAEEALRSTWSVWQLFAGIAGGLACHVITFIFMSMDDPDMGVMDIVISPFRPWKKLLAQMPKRQWVLSANTFSMTAAVGAMFIIGGIPYERVWDWGLSPPPKKNLLAAIAENAPAGGGGDESMEDALGAFANDAAVDGLGGKDNKPGSSAAPTNLLRKKTDALVLGYELDSYGAIATFYVAHEVNGSLVYAGRVNPTFTPDQSGRLLRRLRLAKASRPVVTAPEGANWVQPRFPCRVSYYQRVESGQLQGLLWEEMLGEIKLPW